MSIEKLEETQRAIENLERLDNDLTRKIIIARNEAAKEESQQHLLQFELSQMKIDIEQARDEENMLRMEQNRLIETLGEKNRLVKEMQNSNIISNMLMQTKIQAMEKLQHVLATIDFHVEVNKNRSSGSFDCSTQYPRY